MHGGIYRCTGIYFFKSAASIRSGVLGGSGKVPLSSRETAKDGEQGTQLAALRQVSPVLQRSHPRAKRKPDP